MMTERLMCLIINEDVKRTQGEKFRTLESEMMSESFRKTQKATQTLGCGRVN